MKYLVLACSLLQTILFCSAQDRYHVPYLAIQKLTTGRAICTLFRSGAVKCWGDDSYDSNTRGLLGLGGTHDDIGNRGLSVADMGDNLPIVWLGNKAAPVDIQSVIFTCVLFRDKSVKCWGGGVSGIPQAIAGDSFRSMGSNLQPLPEFPSPIQKMAVGSHHVCFLLENNELRCIGQNKFGELGTQHKDARVVENSIAVNVGQDEANLIVSITAGIGNSCAVFSTGKAKCWGFNGSGVLGQGDRVHRGQKYGELGENLNYIDLGFGGVDNVEILQMDITLHACAIFRLKSDGINSKPRLKCWGDSEFGQTGVGTENRGDEPDEMGNKLPEVSLGTDFTPKLVRVGNAHTCVVRDDDLAMKCFGRNNHGQLGQGSDIEARGTTASQMGDNLPFTILELGESEKIIDVQLSTDTTCVQTTKGIKCFGSNSNGRLGIGKPGDVGSTKESMKNLEYVNLGSVCPPHSNDNGDGRCKCRAGSYGPACEPVRCDTEKGVCSIAGGCSGLYGTGACNKCLGNNYGEDCNVDDALLGPRELRHHASRRRITNMERHLPGLRFAPHEFKSQYITTTRGTEVHVETWYPTTVAQPRGVIYVCHGYADSARWMQRYVHSFYLNQGFAVCAVEYEGHGYSSGYFVYIHDFNGIVDDCDECFQQVHQVFEKRSGASLRRFVSGESMGGGVALCLAMKHKNLWDGLVLCAPMCRIADHVKPSAPMISLLTTIAPLIPKLTVVPSKIGPDIIYKDLNKRMLSVSNPFRFHSVPRLRSAISLLHATEYIDANMEKVTTPILILHGSDDKVTDPVCSKTLYKRVQSKDKTFNLYPGVWHAFLGEPSETSSKIYSDIAAWLDRQAPVLQ